MLAILGPEHPAPTRSLVFAGFYFLVGIIALISSIRSRGQINWKGGTPASIITNIVMILMFFIWGTCSVGDARGWTFFQEHSLILHFGSMAAVFVCFGFDKLREYRSKLRP
jgi:hypothetical protein